jgi:hypothetical protein
MLAKTPVVERQWNGKQRWYFGDRSMFTIFCPDILTLTGTATDCKRICSYDEALKIGGEWTSALDGYFSYQGRVYLRTGDRKIYSEGQRCPVSDLYFGQLRRRIDAWARLCYSLGPLQMITPPLRMRD